MTDERAVAEPLPSPAQPNPPLDRRAMARHRPMRRTALLGSLCLLLLNHATALSAAEASYPFEGSWVRAEHVCNATTARRRTYTAKEVISARGRCSIKRVASGAGSFEILEECRHNDRPATVTETIRMTSPDSMVLRRQLIRLKIPRPIRYTRCNVVAPPPAAGPARPPRPPGFTPPAPEGVHRAPSGARQDLHHLPSGVVDDE